MSENEQGISGDLAAVAAAGQDHDENQGDPGPAEQRFGGTNYAKVRFTGVQYDTLTVDYKIGDEVVFLVRGKVKKVGDVAMKDGHIRHEVGVDVASVIPAGDAG